MTLWQLARPLPTAWRGEGVLQVGLDDPFCLTDAPEHAPTIVAALCHPWRRAHDLTGLGVDGAWAAALWRGLLRRGLLRRVSPPRVEAVALIGAGPLARGIASLLLPDLRVAWVADDASPGRPPHGATSCRPWEVTQTRPAVTVLAGETVEADRPWASALTEAGLPHLVVHNEGDRSVVGPFVVPGRTACLRCIDLARRDRDPAWPLVVAQLQHLAAHPRPLDVAWASAMAAAQVRRFLSGGRPETCDATVELAPHHGLELREWTPHPDCPCRQECWASTSSTASP